MDTNQNIREQARIELAKRQLEKKYAGERNDLIKFMQLYFKEETPKGVPELLVDDYLYVIADRLMQVQEGKITRLIINIPPGHTKTETVTKAFPVWCLGNDQYDQFIVTGYATHLTQGFSQEAKEMYESPTFKKVFPRSPKLSDTQNTKDHWRNQKGGTYYATGTNGSITGKRTKKFIIDDPIKPDEAERSDVKRIAVNNWYKNTVASRLYDPLKDSIIIIMQRVHEDDLCGMIEEGMIEGTGEDFTILSMPAIAEEDETWDTRYGTFTRKKGEPLSPSRFPLEALDVLKKSYGVVNFECQFQQNPTSDATREFHPEWFNIYDIIPTGGRVFTTCDPAFTKKETSDYSAITTVKFIADKLYILEQTVGKYDPGELEDKLIYHIKKWNPQQCGIEAFQAQTVIGYSLRNRLRKENLSRCEVIDVRQPGDKLAKIRGLIALYRNGQIFHCKGLIHLEDQLLKFPRAKHDDAPDSLQMCLYLYEMQPNVNMTYKKPIIKHDHFGRPMLVNK